MYIEPSIGQASWSVTYPPPPPRFNLHSFSSFANLQQSPNWTFMETLGTGVMYHRCYSEAAEDS